MGNIHECAVDNYLEGKDFKLVLIAILTWPTINHYSGETEENS